MRAGSQFGPAPRASISLAGLGQSTPVLGKLGEVEAASDIRSGLRLSAAMHHWHAAADAGIAADRMDDLWIPFCPKSPDAPSALR
jgi:hypothetical protein